MVCPTNDEITRLLEKYEVCLIRYAASMVKDVHQAKDIVQMTFIKYLKAADEAEIKNVHAWLYRVVQNHAFDFMRRKKKHKEKEDALKEELRTPQYGPDKKIDLKDAAERIHEILNEFKERDRSIVIMKIIEQKSYREISEKWDISIGNVGFILHNTLKKTGKIFLENENNLKSKQSEAKNE
ncbi:MAG: sigma-70 family RNA polymerase sigma factor [Verrucomicrobiota bacterium]|nr:sigma-70 family RNA polymerase sigma factor [Verrucomicrobiota bacterium]